MSVDPEIPPAGEEIHLPGGTFLPLFLTVGITMFLVGLTTTLVLVIAGGIIVIWVLIRWVLDARREFNELPAEHHH
jgi:Flp pilus assembly protein TadB